MHTEPLPLDALHWQLAELAEQLRADRTPQQAMACTASAAVALVPGTTGASIHLLRARRRVTSAVHTGALAERVDALQLLTGQGPCLDAVLGDADVRSDDLAAEGVRWPDLAAHLHDGAAPGAPGSGGTAGPEGGPVSVLCVQLRDRGTVFGALELLAPVLGAFLGGRQQVARLLAVHAAAAVADAQRVENLQRGLSHRDVIGQAKGILMERHRLTADQAFELLARASQHTNRKLHELAAGLTATGELPRR